MDINVVIISEAIPEILSQNREFIALELDRPYFKSCMYLTPSLRTKEAGVKPEIPPRLQTIQLVRRGRMTLKW